jgi:arylsulfatase
MCIILSKIGRREFMKTAGIVATASLLRCSSKAVAAGQSPKPDILLIMPDQMRGDCLSILGHPVVRTGQLDELAKQGVLFRRAYTPVASCIPARYALLTGLHPQTSGVVGFRTKPFSTPTLPELLSKAGYSTVLVGRNMHQVPASKSCGYQKRILGSTYVSGDEYDEFLKRSAPETGGIRKLVKNLGITYNHWQAKPWPLADDLHPTAWIVNQSRNIVKSSDAGKPLFLTASFYAPHPPLFPPKRYFNAYLNKKLPPPAHGDWVAWGSLSPKGSQSGHRVLLEGEILRAAQAGYFGLIEHLDAEIASLISDFKTRSEESGRSWVIVVTSDHGEMLGDHGYFRKCEPYEGSANVPFIISGSPALGFKPGMRIEQPVCLEDIMSTLIAIAGTRSPAPLDGVNLVPTLRGDKQTIREWLHFEHAPCYSQAQAYHALTDGHFKYIWRPTDGKEQLFDLDKNLSEEHDLSEDKLHRPTLQAWRRRLVQRLADRPEGFSKNGRLIAGRPYRALNKGTMISNGTAR